MSKKSRQPFAEPYLTIAQAAEHLSVLPSTIRRWIDRGRLPAYRLGEKCIGLRPSDLSRVVTPRPTRSLGRRTHGAIHPAFDSSLTEGEQRRGQQALAELERLGAAIAARYGKLTREPWELLNQSRDERTRDLMRTVEE